MASKSSFFTINHEKNGVAVDTRKQQQHSIHVTFPCKNRCPKKHSLTPPPLLKLQSKLGCGLSLRTLWGEAVNFLELWEIFY